MSHLSHQNISLCACVCVPNPGFTHAGQASYHQPTTAANIFLKTRKTYYKLRKIPQISQNPGKQQCLGLLFETGSVSFRLALNLRSSHLCLMSSGITSGSLYLAYTFIFYNLFFLSLPHRDTCATAHTRRSGINLQEVLFSRHQGLGTEFKSPGLLGKHGYPLSQLAGPNCPTDLLRVPLLSGSSSQSKDIVTLSTSNPGTT